MKQIKITNIDGRAWYSSTFEDEQPLDVMEWRDKKVASGHWGNAEDLTFETLDLTSSYDESRAKEYREIDAMLAEAFVEKELGDSTQWNEYLAKRQEIKNKYPKPE